MTLAATMIDHTPRTFGTPASAKFLWLSLPLMAVNVATLLYVKASGDMSAIAGLVLLDGILCFPLFHYLTVAIVHWRNAAKLKRADFDADVRVYGTSGQLLAFDTTLAKVFHGGVIRPISDIRSVEWVREGRAVYVEVAFAGTRESLYRIGAGNDFKANDIVNAVAGISGWTA